MKDDELKAWFKKECAKDWKKHYPVKALEELGFTRKSCKCGQNFWTTDKKRNCCGEPECGNGLTFIGSPPTKKRLSYVDSWKEYEKLHKKLCYASVKRYPVVARWNPTTDFTIASIAAFQPFVVSGEVAPPANPLVIPQFCLRFPDIDNVGITGHFVGFVMLGEHAFVEPKNYDINKYLKDHVTWLTEGMGIPLKEWTVHEDAWAGGGNFGPCVEFFAKGLEVSNQVYMQYEHTAGGNRELRIKVLDMGQGLERIPWITQGTASIYECVFPEVMKKLRKATKVEYDDAFFKKFVPLSQHVKVEEGVRLEKRWNEVAKQLKMTVEKLKEKVLPNAHLWAVAEHCRALLVAIADSALPSNVGGMYNLRVILRRALNFIEQNNWNVDVCDVCEWHAQELKPLFPELEKHVPTVRKVLEVEKLKFKQTKEKARAVVEKALAKELSTNELIQLYDSQGISPDLLQEEALKQGKKIKVPSNFYALVASRHEQKEQETSTEKQEYIDFGSVPATKALYFSDWELSEFTAKVLKVKNGFVVLDQTAFYPTSGGQLHDNGMLGSAKVVDVFKQGSLIVHKIEGSSLKEGQTVKGVIDFERRQQLAKHHTATHIINAACRKILGQHCNQASARKDVDHAYIDITHYQPISDDELKRIEEEANRIVKAKIKTQLSFMPRNDAEAEFGTDIYQGGAVPGKEIRIVNIPGIDVEACGGTHLKNTAEAEIIKIIKSQKVKDGVVRIYFTAGPAAKKLITEDASRVKEIASVLGVKPSQIPARAQELFEKWKTARKVANKGQKMNVAGLKLLKTDEFKGSNAEILQKCSEILQTQQEHVAKTLKRFLNELEDFKKKGA